MIVLALIMLAACRDRHYYSYKKKGKRLPNRAIFKVHRLRLKGIRKRESRTDVAGVRRKNGRGLGSQGKKLLFAENKVKVNKYEINNTHFPFLFLPGRERWCGK